MRWTAIVVIGIVLAAAARPLAGEPKQDESNAAVVQAMRRAVLETVPEKTASVDEPALVVMDIASPELVVSVMSSTAGDASIYLSNGGAVIGGIGHENVRTAAKAFAQEVARQRSQFTAVTDYAYPTGTNVRFFLRTPRTVSMAEVPQESLVNGQSALATAFLRAQDVIAQLGAISGAGESATPAKGNPAANAALIGALDASDSAKVAAALKAGADANAVDGSGNPALVIAASDKNTAEVQLLLDAGA
ncbi:MAG TPA: hypothetical protein VFP80_13030, partial [Thermoanaerobaculia bacterium]|nr:hypothetical protein [Thermoanaerobaculia bacterium]